MVVLGSKSTKSKAIVVNGGIRTNLTISEIWKVFCFTEMRG